ncbi:MAG: divergent polysaccharide deacetylase family protein [Desulfobacterium sp.]|nr:divergent polysaccharide deacetylase family protein [Desulfobacterium sp.]
MAAKKKQAAKTVKKTAKRPTKKTKKKRPKKPKVSITNELKKIATGIAILVGVVVVCVMVADHFIAREESEKKGVITRAVAPEATVTSPVTVKKRISKKPDAVIHPVKRPVFEVFDDRAHHAIPERKPTPTPVPKDMTPRVAIIIDDIGFDKKISAALADLDRNITLSILPGAPHAKAIAESLHARGSEIMLHLPMEPMEYPKVNPGPGALLSTMTPDELLAQLRRDLAAIPHVKGVNNHMGSRITSLSPQMNQIFTVLKQKNLFFIDSMTSKKSLCKQSARLFQISFAQRDVFLDNIQEPAYIKKQLEQLVKVAKRHGTAIGIGHPYKATYATLKSEMARLKSRIKIVPASTLVSISG